VSYKLLFLETFLCEGAGGVGDKFIVRILARVVYAPKHRVYHSARNERGQNLKGKFDFVRVLVFGKLILYRMSNGILYGAYHFAVAVEAYDVCDVVVLVKEKVHAHNYHRVERFGWGGELRVFGELSVEVVFEFFQSEGQEVIFVLEVSVERGSVDHCFVA